MNQTPAITAPDTSLDQQPDTQPGNYYVTIIHQTKGTCAALGPFPNDHAAALAAVVPVRELCCELDGRLWFDCSWGTARFADTFTTPGKLNTRLPHLLPVTDIATIPDGALLSIGDGNWNLHFTTHGEGTGKSSGTRAIPKAGSGASESGFGSITYFRTYISLATTRATLTPAGKAIIAATHKEIAAIGGAW